MKQYMETDHPVTLMEWLKGDHMKQLLIFFIFVSAALLATNISALKQSPNHSKDASVTIPVLFETNARPIKTWGALCRLENLCALTGIKVAPETMKKVKYLNMIGNQVTGTFGNDKGRLFVTTYEPAHELRVIWEPENGNYISMKRFVLERNGATTAVQYWDRYTNLRHLKETVSEVSNKNAMRVKNFVALFG